MTLVADFTSPIRHSKDPSRTTGNITSANATAPPLGLEALIEVIVNT
jgi:hypothetical protein